MKCDHNINIIDNNERADNRNLLFFGVSYYFVAQKWRILAMFHKKELEEINWKVLRFKTMFKIRYVLLSNKVARGCGVASAASQNRSQVML